MNPRSPFLRTAALAVACLETLPAEQVVISEVMYHPSAGLHEYIEVQNLTATVFDIASWRVSGAVDYEFPAYNSGDPNSNFLQAFERIVICATDPATFRAAYGLPGSIRVLGPWTGSLGNEGERINVRDKNDSIRCTLRYDDRYPWPVEADGGGHSLVLTNTNFVVDDYRNWGASPSRGGTPGSPEPISAEEPFANPEVDLSVGIPFINMADTWRYNDSGANLGTAWKEAGYNDTIAGWKSGQGLFGYETAVVPSPGLQTTFTNPRDNNPYIITYYYRKEFEYNGPLTGVSISIDTILDDGAGFWLNGQWVGGVGVSQGASYTTNASRTVSDATEEEGVISASSPPLVSGTNVVAVEVHQTGANSSDTVFGARLNISAPNAASIVINEVLPAGAGIGFVEFYNPTGSSINLGGWYLSDNASNLTKFQIPGSLKIPSGGLASVGFTESALAVSSPTVVYLTKDDGNTVANAINTSMPLDGRSLGRKPVGGGSWFLFTDSTRNSPNASAEELANFLSINEVHFDAQGDIDWVEVHNSGSTANSTAGLWLSSKRDFSDKIPLGGSIGANGFASWDTAFATGGGDEVLFIVDGSDKVLDAVAVEQRAGRAHSAAFPDGTGDFYAAIVGSRDAPNNPTRQTDVVITELMVEPPSGHRDGEFIELHNRSFSAIDISAWRIDAGASYSFPAGTTIGPGEYLVVAANPEFTSAAHPSARVLGPYSGNLNNNNELVRLIDAAGNLADQVHYATGGDWPFLAGGLGSSLELRHPGMDNSVSTSWADSDESNKSTFQTFSFSEAYQQLNTRGNESDWKELHLHAVGDAHIALRNMDLRPAGGSNYLPNNGEVVVTNGNASTGWLCQGTHHRSHMQGNEFRLISDGHGDVKANRCEIDVTSISNGQTLRWSCEARWIYGKPTLVVHSWDRSFGGIIHLPIPHNLGTPGAPNSAALPNPVPSLSELKHSPAVPTSSDPVRVTARVSALVPLTGVTLRHRLDNAAWSNAWQSATMFDDGIGGGDEVANDDIFTATVSSYQNDNNVVQFYVEASSAGGSTVLPRPAPEAPAMWVVDNSNVPTDLRTQRFIISQRDIDSTNGGTSGSASNNYAFPRLSNHYFNATFIGDENQIIYNCEIRKSGSPWTRSGGADFSRAKWKSPRDKRFRGYTRRSIDNDAGGGRAYHNRIIRHWLYLLGHPANENEFVRVMINGGGASLREDVEPNSNDFLKRNWEDGEKGELYRIDDEWWFDDGWGRDQRNADWSYKGTNEPERYHAEWIKRSRETEYDYSSFVNWVKSVGTDNFTREEMERMADIDMMAANAVVRGWVDDWDTLTRNRGKNGYFLRRYTDGKWMLAQWDSDLTFGNSNAAFLGNLAGVRNFYDKPYVRQRYNYYLGEMIDKYTAGSQRLSTWLQLEEAASGSFSVDSAKFTNWNNDRVDNAESEIGSTAFNMAFEVDGGSSTTTSGDTIDLTGTSGYKVFSVRALGHPEAVWRFTDQTHWTLAGIQLAQGSNPLTVEALDADGNVVHTDSFTVNKTGNAKPVIVLDSNPGSFHVSWSDTLDLDASTSYDPEGTNLAFAWSSNNPSNVTLSNPAAATASATFVKPGLYQISLTATDGAAQQQTLVREASVFAESGWSSFSEPLLEDYWSLENVEVRRDYSSGSWYSLDDRPGKLSVKISDDTARPLLTSNPNHPIIWRDVPDTTDCAVQTDVEMVSVQQGDFISGLILEVQEGATAARYVFALEDGDFLRVKRSTGGSYSTVDTTNWAEAGAVIRIRREGTQLKFDRRLEPGVWSNVYTRTIPGGSVLGRAGLFAATDTPQGVRLEFDYFMLVDPETSSPTLANLRITELMYHPAALGGSDWLELMNTGGSAIELAGVNFPTGDPFDAFSFGALSLQPGEVAVLVQDAAAFQSEYGTGIRILGQWAGGALSNGGEKVVLNDPANNIIHDFIYDDVLPWPLEADGAGSSLEVIDTEGDYNDPANWRASPGNGGTPGVVTSFDSDGDGLSDADEASVGTDPFNPDSDYDGSLDGAEVVAGTDPLDANSRFEITSLSRNPANGHITASWSTVAGRSYTLQSRTDLTSLWTDVVTGVVASGTTTSHIDAAAAGQQRTFYRAVLE